MDSEWLLWNSQIDFTVGHHKTAIAPDPDKIICSPLDYLGDLTNWAGTHFVTIIMLNFDLDFAVYNKICSNYSKKQTVNLELELPWSFILQV